MTVSKTLGGGIPLAGVITTDAIEESCHRRGFAFYTSHVSDPLPATVGLAVLQTIEDERLLARSREMGEYLAERLADLQQRHEEIGDVRGMGLLRGIELVRDRETREPHHELGALTTDLRPGTDANEGDARGPAIGHNARRPLKAGGKPESKEENHA
jgi:2,2-dialkylglycine decarboxylase (pyruvate)